MFDIFVDNTLWDDLFLNVFTPEHQISHYELREDITTKEDVIMKMLIERFSVSYFLKSVGRMI